MSLKVTLGSLGLCALTMSCMVRSNESSDLQAASTLEVVPLADELKYFDQAMTQIVLAADGVCYQGNRAAPTICDQIRSYDFNSDTRAKKVRQFVVPTKIDPFDPNKNDAPLAVLRGLVNNKHVNTAFMSAKRYAAVEETQGAKIYVGSGRSSYAVRSQVIALLENTCPATNVVFLPADLLNPDLSCRVVNSKTICRYGVYCKQQN